MKSKYALLPAMAALLLAGVSNSALAALAVGATAPDFTTEAARAGAAFPTK